MIEDDFQLIMVEEIGHIQTYVIGLNLCFFYLIQCAINPIVGCDQVFIVTFYT